LADVGSARRLMDFKWASLKIGYLPIPICSFCFNAICEWIGLRENVQESPIFNGKIYGFRLNFSLKPIH
jgi:hypothetical protein